MVDFHCHLDLQPDPRAVTAECESRGIRILSVTTTPRAWLGTVGLVRKPNIVMTALGIHPQLAVDSKQELKLFLDLLPETRFVGEIGIDGSAEFQSRLAQQVHIFGTILSACEDAGGRVLSIHSRNATALVLNQIEETVKSSIPILHWFSGTQAELERAKRLNCWFSVGPPMLYSAKGMQLVRRMPRDRILTETDSPFVQFGGKVVMPWDISSHYLQLSHLLTLDGQASAKLVEDNCERLVESAS